MTITRATKGYVKIVAAQGYVILDLRNNRKYSEVVVEESILQFFIEVDY